MKNHTTKSPSNLENHHGLFKHIKYEHLIAGVSGGAISTLILHPLDLLKIRFAGKLLNNWQPAHLACLDILLSSFVLLVFTWTYTAVVICFTSRYLGIYCSCHLFYQSLPGHVPRLSFVSQVHLDTYRDCHLFY